MGQRLTNGEAVEEKESSHVNEFLVSSELATVGGSKQLYIEVEILSRPARASSGPIHSRRLMVIIHLHR